MWEISLHGRYAGGGVAVVDDVDYDRVAAVRWYPTRTGYAWGRVGGRMTLLHRDLLGAGAGVMVDHVNGDRLDCRRENLRVATPGENKANSRKRSDAGLPYKGIERTRSGRYRAVLTVGGRRHRSPTYGHVAEAASAYDEMSRQHFGAFARLNFVPVRAKAVLRWAAGNGRPAVVLPAVAGDRGRREVVAEIESNLLPATPLRS